MLYKYFQTSLDKISIEHFENGVVKKKKKKKKLIAV